MDTGRALSNTKTTTLSQHDRFVQVGDTRFNKLNEKCGADSEVISVLISNCPGQTASQHKKIWYLDKRTLLSRLGAYRYVSMAKANVIDNNPHTCWAESSCLMNDFIPAPRR